MKTIQVSIILILFCILSAQDSIYVNFKLPYLQLQPTLFGGDLNGDGFDDMVFVGMRKIDQYHLGVLETMIFFGETYIDSFPDIAYINTPEIPSYKICYNGDLNGDGINDMVLSDIGYPDWYNYGMLWIILGKSDFQMEPDYIMYGIDYFHGDYPYDSYFGIDIDCSGDFNGDGFDDLYVYAPGTSPEDYGYFWVFNGGPEIDTTDDYFHKGEYNSFTGESYSIGDINGDGFDDLIISRFDYDISEYVFDVYAGSENGLSENPVRTFIKEDNLYNEYDISGDFDGDGKNDLMKHDGHTCFISYGNENYEFERDINFLFNPYQFDSWPSKPFDIDLDGRSDIATTNHTNTFDSCFVKIYCGSDNGLEPIPKYTRKEMVYDGLLAGTNLGFISSKKYPSMLSAFRDNSSDEWYFCFSSLYDLESKLVEPNNVKKINLEQNYPNPFNPITEIKYDLTDFDVNNSYLIVTNYIGQEILREKLDKSNKSSNYLFDGSSLSSGTYIYSIEVNGKTVESKSMVLIK